MKNTKDHIIANAVKIINIKGFGACSVDQLIRASGVKKGCFYYHFSSKEQLGLEVIECARCRFMNFLDEYLTEAKPRKALDNFFKAALEMHLDKGFVGGCLFGNIALETADGNSAISEAVGRVFSDWTTRLEKVVAAGQKEGEITRTLNAHTLATLIISSVEGSVMLSRLNKTEKHLKGVLDSLRVLLFTTETSHP